MSFESSSVGLKLKKDKLGLTLGAKAGSLNGA
jgi:hypothetical protein